MNTQNQNMDHDSSHSAHNVPAKTPTTKSNTASAMKMPSLGGISLAEIAVLGAGGYVMWKNRSKIQALLEKNGIEVPSILSGDFSELLRKGAKALGAEDSKEGGQNSSRPSTPSSGRLDG